MSASNQAVLDFLSSSANLSDADIYSFMQSKGVPASQIASVTGIPLSDVVSRVSAVAPAANMLGGTILAGDSWLAGADKTALANTAFGQNVSNVAVGGSTTKDALNQLDSFINNGGNFQTGSTIVLDIGGNDLLQGVDKNTIKSNLNELVSKLGNEGVKVILSGAPSVGSVSDVTSSNKLAMDSLYSDVAKTNKNVTLVDAMSGLLNDKTLVDTTGFHLNTAGQTSFINQLANAANPQTTPPAAIAELAKAPTSNTAPSSQNTVDKLTQQILGQGTTDKWTGQGKGSAQANAADMASILAGIGITDINQFGQIEKTVVDEDGNKSVSKTYGNKVTGQEVPSTYGERQTDNAFGGTFDGKGNTGYRVEFDASGKPLFYTTGASSSDVPSWVMPVLSLAAGYFAPGLGNALLGAGANQIAAGALGGGLLGGGLAAVTGQDVLKGALTGGIGGAIAGYFSPSTGQVTTTPTPDSIPFSYDDLGIDYSLANGTQMRQLTDMGGAQGLQAGTSANLADMGGAQGFTFNAGAPVTTLAELTNAINTMNGSYNPANLADMGGGQGLTYQTPTGLVTQGGLIPTGGMTGNNDVIGAAGVNRAFNIGDSIGTNLANVNTNVYNPAGGMLSSTVTGFNPDGTPVTKAPTDTGSILDKLTPSQIANIIAGVGGLVGGAGVANVMSNKTTPTGVSIPTQGVPLNTQDYYTAIQQNYNRLLPAVPRDVATPLAQWYNSQYGA